MVDVKKVFDALKWLKYNNTFYNLIVQLDTHDELCLKKLNNPQFEIQEAENDSESVLNNNHKLSSKNQIIETENNVETIVKNNEAMST